MVLELFGQNVQDAIKRYVLWAIRTIDQTLKLD